MAAAGCFSVRFSSMHYFTLSNFVYNLVMELHRNGAKIASLVMMLNAIPSVAMCALSVSQ